MAAYLVIITKKVGHTRYILSIEYFNGNILNHRRVPQIPLGIGESNKVDVLIRRLTHLLENEVVIFLSQGSKDRFRQGLFRRDWRSRKRQPAGNHLLVLDADVVSLTIKTEKNSCGGRLCRNPPEWQTLERFKKSDKVLREHVRAVQQALDLYDNNKMFPYGTTGA